jgi:hypothetical protein
VVTEHALADDMVDDAALSAGEAADVRLVSHAALASGEVAPDQEDEQVFV